MSFIASVLKAGGQSETEAGTEAGLRSFSPLRIAQAIAALAAQYGDATANFTGTLQKSGNAVFDEGTSEAARVFVQVDMLGTFTLVDSLGVDSVVDGGVGLLTVNITSGVMANADYLLIGTASYNNGTEDAMVLTRQDTDTKTTSACVTRSKTVNTDIKDSDSVSIILMGGQ